MTPVMKARLASDIHFPFGDLREPTRAIAIHSDNLDGRRTLPYLTPYAWLMQLAFAELQRATARFGRWLIELPLPWFAAFAFVVFAMKSTLLWRGSFFYAEAAAFPKPASPFSSSILAVLIHVVSEPIPGPTLLLSSLAALALAVFLLYRCLTGSNSTGPQKRIALILALTWPAVLGILPWLGNGTAFLALFMVVAVCSRKWPFRLAGILGATMTHPEQSLVAFGLLFIIATSREFARFKMTAIAGFVIAACGAGLAAAWIATEPLMSRGPLLSENFVYSVRFSMRYGILGVYTWWGVWWILIIMAFLLFWKSMKYRLLLVTIVVPGIFAVVTDNYTRVFVGTASAVGIAIAVTVMQRLASNNSADVDSSNNMNWAPAVGFWFLAYLLLPNLHFMMPGDGIPTPGFYWVGLVENFLAQ